MIQRLTMARTMIIIIVLLLVAMAVRVPADTDTWWHLRSAGYVLDNGTIQGDPFSHTMPGGTWINHSWGAQMVLYGFWLLGGDAGLALYTAVFAVGGMLILLPVCAGNAYLRSLLLVIGAAAAAVFWSARPQMISFFFSTVVLFLLYQYKRHDRDWLWGIVPLFWLWGNSHAGWSIGYLFIFAFIVGETFNAIFGTSEHPMGWRGLQKLLLVTLLSIPTIAISPYGIDMLLVPLNTVSIGPLRQFIQEWNSPNFQGRETWPFIALVIGLFGALWGSRLKFDWSSFFLLSGTLFLALLYGRNIAVFAPAATIILSHHLDNILQVRGWILRPKQRVSRTFGAINILLVSLISISVLLYCIGVLLPATVEPLQDDILPVDVAHYLAENDLPREMFNSYNWGGYLMFAAPQYPVFIDGRTDLYGDFLETYFITAQGRGDWRETLREYAINFVVVENGSGLDTRLRDEPGWQLVYMDDLAVVHLREILLETN